MGMPFLVLGRHYASLFLGGASSYIPVLPALLPRRLLSYLRIVVEKLPPFRSKAYFMCNHRS